MGGALIAVSDRLVEGAGPGVEGSVLDKRIVFTLHILHTNWEFTRNRVSTPCEGKKI